MKVTFSAEDNGVLSFAEQQQDEDDEKIKMKKHRFNQCTCHNKKYGYSEINWILHMTAVKCKVLTT